MHTLDGNPRSGGEATHAAADARHVIGSGPEEHGPRPGEPRESEPSERALVRAAMEGSTAACEALYRRHAPTALRVAQAVTHNPDDAADAVAEAFTRVFTALPSGRLGSDLAFRPYLLAATRNAAIDGLRKAGRLRTTDEIEGLAPPAPASGPAERLMIGDDRRKMAEAFAALPERWRTVLWMTEVEEMPAREVAERLGLSANGVAQLAVRARAGLRDRYLQAHVRNHARPRCAFTVERLGAYVGGGLAPRDIAKVDQHLAGCADCAARLVEVEDVGSTLRRIALPLPLGLGAIVLKQLAVEQLGLGLPSTVAGTARRALAAAGAGSLRRAVGAAAGASALVIGLGGMAFVGPAPSEPPAGVPRARAAAVTASNPSPPAPSPPSTPAAAPTPEVPDVAAPAAPSVAPPTSPGGANVPELRVPPVPPVHVGLPPIAVPVEATVGAAVGGVAVAVGVGPCTGVVAGPVTAGCPPTTPSGTGVHLEVPGVVAVNAG